VFCHTTKLLVPSITRTTGGAKDQMIALHLKLNLIGETDLIQEHLWDANTL